MTQKTVSLLERGLSQVKETVAALLVEAKVKSRPLNTSDFDDVRVLVSHAIKKQSTQMHWVVTVPDGMALPSTLVRQVLINLLLNAIAASGRSGRVSLQAKTNEAQLVMVVENTGTPMLPEQLARLYEPFTSFSENGNGLGLWICYQIVTQLTQQFQRFRIALTLSGRMEGSITQHRDIIKAFRDHDADRAEILVRENAVCGGEVIIQEILSKF